MSNISKRRREGPRAKLKDMGDHNEFLKRITKTLYYGQLPSLPCLSLPVTEISCSVWSLAQRGRSVRRLRADEAARIARGACVSPCALVLALLYLERLQCCNPVYLAAAPPNELFLVSLMIGNKFLQDDGEDDEVICSEWAASGGLDLQQLKKLEVQFLNAIDWKVYVSEEAFEKRLVWLERQVALKQAALRGFFTYADLAAAGDCGATAGLLRHVTAACAALALAYLASLAALLASTLLVSHAWPSAHPITQLDAHHTAVNTPLPHFNNATVEFDTVPEEPPVVAGSHKCCTDWLRYQQVQGEFAPQKNWYDGAVLNDWKSHEPWWSTTAVMNWLYQSSLINPMQRWLDNLGAFSELLASEVPWSRGSGRSRDSGAARARPSRDRRPHCMRQWLNLSKLNTLLVTVSDR